MTTRAKSFLVGPTAIGLLLLSGGVSRLNGAAPQDVSIRTAPPNRRSALVARKTSSPRMTRDECSALAVNATLARVHAEMRSLLPAIPKDLADVGTAMNSDRRLSEGIKRTFANTDLIMSEYSERGECVVTLKLSVDRLRLLARDL
jgi:hypothetical protein